MRYYKDGDYLGLYPTPSSSEAIRVHFYYYPTTLSADSDAMGLPDDYKDLIAFKAALIALRKLLPKNPQKYLLIKQSLMQDMDIEEGKLYGRRSDGEKFIKISRNDF